MSTSALPVASARAGPTITGRVLEYLRSADRIIETTLAPATLLAQRFGLLPQGTDAAELDALLSNFYRLPQLPKLASQHVLRQSLAEGVGKGLFGLASGSAWDAEDAVLRFTEAVDPSEIQFQPGTWLVRAAAIKELLAKRAATSLVKPTLSGPEPRPVDSPVGVAPTPGDTDSDTAQPAKPSGPIPSVTIHVKNVPASKMRDVLKIAVLPMSAASADVIVELSIHADGGLAGIPRETLNLVTLEGLRQLGLSDVDVIFHEKG